MIINSLLVAIGGVFGALCRFAVTLYAKKRWASAFPIATLFINLLGAFLLGWMTGKTPQHWILLLFGTGFMGAFTTFSTFKLESIQLFQNQNRTLSFVYLGTTYLLGILLAYLGIKLGIAS
jgi:CrcB protein